MRPSSGRCAPERIFIKVLLPAPFSPTRARTSPACTERSTPSMRRSSPAMGLLEEVLNFRSVDILRRNEGDAAVDILRDLFAVHRGDDSFDGFVAHFGGILGDERLDLAFLQR